MSLSPRQIEERKIRQDKIAQSAIEVYAEKGIDGITMNEIAQRSGFGKATLYHYFASKEDVLRALLKDGWKNIWQIVEESCIEQQSPKEKLTTILKLLAVNIQNDRHLYSFLFKAPQAYPVIISPAWRLYQEKMYKTLADIIDQGVEAGDFINLDPQILMKAVGGLFHGLLLLGDTRTTIGEDDLEKLVEQILVPQS